ncbi:MAG TPA: MerR family transcriptional regulator [Chloroflexaceae bacterium]|nr:MerR family transcriptional regulator [Chloroflexaceae bacterium]
MAPRQTPETTRPADGLLTIGQLARRVGLRPSALRFYEAEGLLAPQAHSPAGYRLYSQAAEETLRFIQRAQRLGFALADIAAMLPRPAGGAIGEAELAALARERLIALERQLTPLLVQRHELGLFLRDLQAAPAGARRSPLDRLIDQVCAEPHARSPDATLDQLLAETGCIVAGDEGRALLARLRGHHVHIWQEGDAFHILVVSADPEVGAALERLAALEPGCHAVASGRDAPELRHADQGFLFVARGAHAFLFARLFLALEQA